MHILLIRFLNKLKEKLNPKNQAGTHRQETIKLLNEANCSTILNDNRPTAFEIPEWLCSAFLVVILLLSM
ncbi:unnamed protein product [Clavelina lepadiformis]|uniref:Uncharacterized protein n=1 Tax=Clavelina lepadiformis TaxID=159417 RepID=A0ABP0GGV6_CLALP